LCVGVYGEARFRRAPCFAHTPYMSLWVMAARWCGRLIMGLEQELIAL